MKPIEYDQRQYQLMKEFLEGFENGRVNIRVLIDSLRSLLNILQQTNNDWIRSFKKEWWTLEEIYSLALAREQTQLSEAEENLVYEAVNNMKKLLSIVIIDGDY